MNTSDIVTKTEFARMVGRSQGAVSHWIAEGKIAGEAMVGEGTRARIRVPVALAQLGMTLDLGQQLAQARPVEPGAQDQAPASNPAPAERQSPGEASAGAADNTGDNVESFNTARAIQAERLRQERIKTRELEAKEAERRGLYVRASAARAEMVSRVSRMVVSTELFLGDVAADLAAAGPLDEDAIADRLLKGFRRLRQSWSDAAAADRDAADRLEPAETDGEDDGEDDGEGGADEDLAAAANA